MIEFDISGKHYKLEVTANTIMRLENEGVNFGELDHMLTSVKRLWYGLFYEYHSGTSRKKMDEIFNALSPCAEGDTQTDDEDALVGAIFDQYNDAVQSLQRVQGNVAWTRT